MTKATIDDVAELAGVSIKTVSRVVNREPNVRESTRDRVELAIAELKVRILTPRRAVFCGGVSCDRAQNSVVPLHARIHASSQES